jgi:hypothetical protein
VILVHGELEGLEALARNLEKEFEVEIPSVLEEVKI